MSIFIYCPLKRASIRRVTLGRVIRRLLHRLGEAEADVSIGFIGDARMRRLNRTYRRQDRTTDVLAFAYREVPRAASSMLGDVVISIPTARRQAKAWQRSLDEEVLRLLIHGILHLVGYDHEQSRREAQRMRRKEAALWQTMVPVPRVIESGESPIPAVKDGHDRRGLD